MAASKTASCFQGGVRFQDGTLQATAAFATPPGGSVGDIQYNNSGAFGGYTLVPLKNGGTHTDLSGTGGTSYVLRQSTLGGNITVSQLAYSEISGTPTLPATTAAVSHQWLASYNAGTGAFTQTQPAFTDISGSIALGQTVLTTLGDTQYVAAGPILQRLAGNITTTKMYLSQTGSGAASAAPAWAQINYADITGTIPTPPSGSVLWSALGNAGAGLTLANGANATEFDQTSNVIWLWKNTTTATSGTTNASPLLELVANYWTGSASASDTWSIGTSLAAGTNGISTLTLGHSGSSGSAVLSLGGLGFVKIPDGTTSQPGLVFTNGSTTGISRGSFSSSGVMFNIAGSGTGGGFTTSSGATGFQVGNAMGFLWSSIAAASSSVDTGITRIGAGSLAIGNGTAGDTTGNLSFNNIIKYGGVATVKSGIGSQVAYSDLTAQTAAIAATTIYAVPAAGAGLYRISYVATITTAASVSSVLGGSVGFQVKFTNKNDSVVKTSNPTTPAVSAINATGTTVSGNFFANCKASTNLQYLFDYTSVNAAEMAYDLSVRVEYLG